MASENLTWGAERIRGELLKLCISISKRTIQKYMDRDHNPSSTSQTWPTFLKNHAPHIWACDFVQIYDLFFRTLFVFVVIEHSSRRIVHSATTAHPTDAWVAHQLKEATPWGEGPRFLIHDNDGKLGNRFSEMLIAQESKKFSLRFVGQMRIQFAKDFVAPYAENVSTT